MGLFSYMYYQSFIAVNKRVSVGGVLETVVTSLSPEEQLDVVRGLHTYLVGQGIIDERVSSVPQFNLQESPYSRVIDISMFK